MSELWNQVDGLDLLRSAFAIIGYADTTTENGVLQHHNISSVRPLVLQLRGRSSVQAPHLFPSWLCSSPPSTTCTFHRSAYNWHMGTSPPTTTQNTHQSHRRSVTYQAPADNWLQMAHPVKHVRHLFVSGRSPLSTDLVSAVTPRLCACSLWVTRRSAISAC